MLLMTMLLYSIAASEPVRIEDVAPLAQELLLRHGVTDDVESAAFLVRAADQALSLEHWPRLRTFRSSHWNGALPDGVVGVIHTHPTYLPFPSEQDLKEAQRLGMPFYVVSRNSLCVAHPADGVSCTREVPWVPHIGRQRNAEQRVIR